MDNPKSDKIAQYTTGILIAIGLYIVSMSAGSMLNIIIAYSAGYKKYSDFLNSNNITGLLAVAFSGLAIHIFAGWLTTNIMTKYGRKKHCLSNWFFGSAAISVILFALTVIPLLFSKTPGWSIYISHSLSILLFGRGNVKKYAAEQSLTTSESAKKNAINDYTHERTAEHINIQPATSIQEAFIFCHKCGTKLNIGTRFCHKCGTKVAR